MYSLKQLLSQGGLHARHLPEKYFCTDKKIFDSTETNPSLQRGSCKLKQKDKKEVEVFSWKLI
jgi:hypothetical protein